MAPPPLAVAGVRTPGDFCWFNLLSPQPADARAFFGSVLKWTYDAIPGVGHTVLVGGAGGDTGDTGGSGKKIGGIFDVVSAQTPNGTAPAIVGMVKVASVDATCATMREHGGKVKYAFDIGANLRMAVTTAPEGADIDLFEPKGTAGTEADTRVHGAPALFELRSASARAVADYCGAVFGWTSVVEEGAGAHSEVHVVCVKEGRCVARVREVPAHEVKATGPRWTVYFTATDLDATEKTAVDLGATVLEPAAEMKGVGRVSVLVSPQGVRFGLVQHAA